MKRSAFKILALSALLTAGMLPSYAHGEGDPVVYSVQRALDMGNPGETPQKDYYLTVGTAEGVHEGTVLDVFRRAPTYDLVNQKLYREVTFPIAQLKVIHAEANVAIARLEKMLPSDKTPVIQPDAVVVGDLVRVAE